MKAGSRRSERRLRRLVQEEVLDAEEMDEYEMWADWDRTFSEVTRSRIGDEWDLGDEMVPDGAQAWEGGE